MSAFTTGYKYNRREIYQRAADATDDKTIEVKSERIEPEVKYKVLEAPKSEWGKQ